MPYFAIIGHDHPPHSMPLRDKMRVAHRTYVRQQGEMIRMAGAFRDKDGNQCGSLFIVEADSAEQVREWFDKEPFRASGVYKDVEITDIRVAMNQLDKLNFGPIADPAR